MSHNGNIDRVLNARHEKRQADEHSNELANQNDHSSYSMCFSSIDSERHINRPQYPGDKNVAIDSHRFELDG